MEESTFNESKFIDQKQQYQIINEYEDKENIIIICFDPKNQVEHLKQRFNQINHNVIFHTELESCIISIQSNEKQNNFLIISSSQILSHINHLHQTNFIFIFSSNYDRDVLLSFENSKVSGIYDNLDALYSSVQEQINICEETKLSMVLF